MIYVFVFLGEFGYELFNWQGVIRKFSNTISKEDRIVCCSRANLYPLYETADIYIDISDHPLFQQSVACGYVGMAPQTDMAAFPSGSRDYNIKRPIQDFYYSYNTPNDLKFDSELKAELKRDIIHKLFSVYQLDASSAKFIFSSERHEMNGCLFGCDRMMFQIGMKEGDIYENLNLNNNQFQKILPDLSVAKLVKKKCGIVGSDYILVQMAERNIVRRSRDKCHQKNELLQKMAKKIPLVLLNFSTGRNLDSYSQFDQIPNCHHYHCSSFVEQSYLIHASKICLFFTEGDFRSHMYVPPFLGKDVLAVAPRSVYQLKTSPIDFWNSNVFQFGGQMIPFCSEDVVSDPSIIWNKFLKITEQNRNKSLLSKMKT